MTWRFLTNVQHTYDREKKLVEKYDVSSTGTGGGGGEYPLQDGFGWTNGVTLKMLDLICPQKKPCDSVRLLVGIIKRDTDKSVVRSNAVTRVYSLLTRRQAGSTLKHPEAVSCVAEGGKSPAPQ
ncbi:trehalase [Salmonella enterica subsp. arizonae]|nr:trehalase [Salmonella enterica subsp. arizonae]